MQEAGGLAAGGGSTPGQMFEQLSSFPFREGEKRLVGKVVSLLLQHTNHLDIPRVRLRFKLFLDIIFRARGDIACLDQFLHAAEIRTRGLEIDDQIGADDEVRQLIPFIIAQSVIDAPKESIIKVLSPPVRILDHLHSLPHRGGRPPDDERF